jgi:hypothetical protein
LVALLLAGASWASADVTHFVHGPYKHAPLGFERDTHRMMTTAGGRPAPLAQALPPGTTVSWAFATGACGDEGWGEGIATERFAQANVAAFVEHQLGYIVSTGGQGQQFTCNSDAGMERFIARYQSPQLVGFDFDIEAGQTDADIDALVQRVKGAQRRHPSLRFSFTLPTFAAVDGSGRSLNRIGQRVLRAIRRHGLKDVVFNLMVMNYGDARASRCVPKRTAEGARCDMGRSGLQAALNLQRQHGVPLNRIALTAMLGVNDVVHNVFTLDDAARLARDARQHGLAGVHYWSLDRDAPCHQPQTGASPTCSGLALEPLAFTRALVQALR